MGTQTGATGMTGRSGTTGAGTNVKVRPPFAAPPLVCVRNCKLTLLCIMCSNA
jgi:hypothetical protein